MARTYLLSSIGLPGSGKSTFLRRFSEEQKFFYWQNDEARRRLFNPRRHTTEEDKLLGQAGRYALGQALQTGLSSIYDVNLNRREHRALFRQLAEVHQAKFWLLWFQVPLEVARARVQRRTEQATSELRAYYDGFDPDFLERMRANLQEPTRDEHVIILDGEAPYETLRQQVLAQA
ncbi:MAG: hypothetical protein JWN01_501 [Patescibacteria group bacterium]|nr:hypothetical protein [Patescibacteria group bacterium]